MEMANSRQVEMRTCNLQPCYNVAIVDSRSLFKFLCNMRGIYKKRVLRLFHFSIRNQSVPAVSRKTAIRASKPFRHQEDESPHSIMKCCTIFWKLVLPIMWSLNVIQISWGLLQQVGGQPSAMNIGGQSSFAPVIWTMNCSRPTSLGGSKGTFTRARIPSSSRESPTVQDLLRYALFPFELQSCLVSGEVMENGKKRTAGTRNDEQLQQQGSSISMTRWDGDTTNLKPSRNAKHRYHYNNGA